MNKRNLAHKLIGRNKEGKHKLSYEEIVEAFPSECARVLPKKIKESEESLKPLRAYFYFVDRSSDYEEIEKLIYKMVQQLGWKFLLDRLSNMEKLYMYYKNKGYKGEELDIDKAREVKIESLHGFGKMKTVYGRITTSCPFHQEKTPSFVIYKDNHFHCFGCQAHGDSIEFVMKLFGINFIDAVKYLLKRY